MISLELLSEASSLDVYFLKKRIESILSGIYLLDQLPILIQKVLKKIQGNC